MAITRYDFEAGSDGVSVSAGGDITAISGSPPTYDSVAAFHSSDIGIKSIGTQWAEWMAPDNDWSGSVYMESNVNPGTGSQRAIVFRTSTSTIAGAIRFHSSGAIGIVNSANVLVLGASTQTWDTDDQFRFDWQVNTIAPDVEISLRIFKNSNIDGTTPDDTIVRTLAATNVERFRVGGFDSGSWTVRFDDLAVSDVLEWIGPYSGPAPLPTPVVTVIDENLPTTPGGSNGSIIVTWPAVSGAGHYEAEIANGHDSTGGWVTDDLTATSPHTFSGLESGLYTVAITAVP